jgi:hypothetical protein
MRIAALAILIGAGCRADVWQLNAARSTFAGDTRPKALTVRIEPHAKGEVFTVDRVEPDGRVTTSSTILYFDSTPRDFQDRGCSGTQSSRRVDAGTVEILRNCAGGGWIRFLRRAGASPAELILDIIEQLPDGRRFVRRLVLQKQ